MFTNTSESFIILIAYSLSIKCLSASSPFWHYFTMLCPSSLLQLLRPASWVPAGIVPVVWIHQTGEHNRPDGGRSFTHLSLRSTTGPAIRRCQFTRAERGKCKFVLLEAHHFSAVKTNLLPKNMPAKQIMWVLCMEITIMHSCIISKSSTSSPTKWTKEVLLYTSISNSSTQIRSWRHGASLGDSSSNLANSSLGFFSSMLPYWIYSSSSNYMSRYSSRDSLWSNTTCLPGLSEMIWQGGNPMEDQAITICRHLPKIPPP